VTVYLSFDNLLLLAQNVTAPARPVVRDAGLLESAAARPQTTVYGAEAYRTLTVKAAALMESIARNHPLIDGNKRLAWHAATVFLLLNGTTLAAPSVSAGEKFVLDLAQGRMTLEEIADRIASWCR
jgi:death-on-curing protein